MWPSEMNDNIVVGSRDAMETFHKYVWATDRTLQSSRAEAMLADYLSSREQPPLSIVTFELQYSRPGGRKHAYPTAKPFEAAINGKWVTTPCRYCWEPSKGAKLGGVGKAMAPVYSTKASEAWRRKMGPSDGCWAKAECDHDASGACASCEWVERPASTRERASEW